MIDQLLSATSFISAWDRGPLVDELEEDFANFDDDAYNLLQKAMSDSRLSRRKEGYQTFPTDMRLVVIARDWIVEQMGMWEGSWEGDGDKQCHV